MEITPLNGDTRHQDNPNALLDRIRQRNADRAAADKQLPLWPDPTRGLPNGVLRSALFGAIKRGKRRYLEREPIASLKSISIIYTGPRLNQSDLDVWAGALHLARLGKLGNRIEFGEKGFLRLIGRGGPRGDNIGKGDREWLRKVLARLKATAVEVIQGPYSYTGSLIDEYFRDSSSNRYVMILNPRMRALFNSNSHTWLDWSIRHALIGYPLAQWLHGFYSTHSPILPYKPETLHRLCGSEAGGNAKTDAERHKALLDWIDNSLVPALEALKQVSNEAGHWFSWEFSNDGLIEVEKMPVKAKQKISQPARSS